MRLRSDPRNLPQKFQPSHTPATPRRGSTGTETNRARQFSAEGVATILGAGTAFVMIEIAIWGFWVAPDVVRHANTSIVGAQQHKLNAAIFLTWLVIFGPFLFFGIMILRSTFARENPAWLVSLRVFTYIVSLRARAEIQRREFFRDSNAKQLPSNLQDKYLELPSESAEKAKDR